MTLDGRFTTLTGAVTGSSDLTITASRSLRINNNINTGAGNLTLTGGSGGLNLNGGIAVGEVKTLSGADITLTGDARSNRDLTFTASGTLRINSNITLTSARNITLTSTGGAVRILADIITTDGNITLSGSTGGINFNGGGAKTFSGADITLTGDAQSNRDLTFTASGTLGINSNITLTGARALSLSGGTGGINFNGGGAKTLSSADITLTGVVVSNRDLTFTASGTLRIESNITLTEAGALSLTSTGGLVRIFADISSDGNITLNGNTGINLNGGTAKTLSGAAIMLTGTAQSNRNLTITAAGVLTLNSDIIVGTRTLELSGSGIALGGALTLDGRFTTLTGAATGSADLTITASRNLRLNSSITTGAGNLTLSGGTGSTGGALNLNGGIAVGEVKTFSGADITLTGAARSNRAVTITASGTLRINNDISVTGARALTLTSTGGLVRMFANISSDGNITLNGANGINLNGGTAKTLSGAIIMLTGNAQSNRTLTITATSVLTLNSDIIAGTRTLELSGSSIALGGALTLTGRSTTLTGAATGSTDLTITASRTLRLNNDITTGAGNLTLSGGTGGLNLNGGIAVGEVKTFSGADITLTGDARSNRDLTITATGVLTINNNIDIGTRALILEATAAPTFGAGAADLMAGEFTFTPDFSCTGSTTPRCTVNTP